MNIDQLLTLPQSAEGAANPPKSVTPTGSEAGTRSFRGTLNRAAGQEREDQPASLDAPDPSPLRSTKWDSNNQADADAQVESSDAADPLDSERNPLTGRSVSQAQLAWLLAQLASVTNQTGLAVPIDGNGAAAGTEVHSTSVTDLSRLVGAKALVATTVGTTGTPTPQATNEIAATNVEAQEISSILTGTTIQSLVAATPVPAQTEPVSDQGAQASSLQTDQLKLELIDPHIAKSSQGFAEANHSVTTPQTEAEPPVVPTVPVAPSLDAGDLSASTTEIGAAENQAARGVLVRRSQVSSSRQTKIDGGPMVGDKLITESGRAELQSSIAATGEGQEQQFESNDGESGQADRMQWQGDHATRSRETISHTAQVSPFSLHAQNVSDRNQTDAKVTASAAPAPLDADPPLKAAGPPTIRLEVSPPDMGRVQLRVSVSEHSVYTNVITDQAGVRDLLLRQHDRLQDALGAYGLGMGSFNVEVGQQGQQRSEWGGQPDARTLARLAEEVPRPETHAVASAEWDERGLNLFA